MSTSSSVEKLSGLKRRIDITVPADKVTELYNQRIKKVATTAKLDGFQPGKSKNKLVETRKMKVVESRFGKGILAEVAEELMKSNFARVIDEQKLKVAGMRPIAPDQELRLGNELKFSAEVELYPEIHLADMTNVKLERSVVAIEETDIDEMISTLLKQNADWVESDKPAQKGSKVIIDFEGKIDGNELERGSAKDFHLELGQNRMIPGFEDDLIGAKAGETREVTCTFPKDYPRPELADQTANFVVQVKQVLEPKEPEVNEEFAKKLGVEGGVNELRTEVKETMQKQVEHLLRDQLKMKVLQKLAELNPIEVPDCMVAAEIQHLHEMTKERTGVAQNQTQEQMKTLYGSKAEERVRLGLLLGEIIKKYHLKADDQKVRERIEMMASAYPQPEQFVAWYYGNKQMLAEVESVVLEDQATEKLLEQMQVQDKNISYKEATKPHQHDENCDHDHDHEHHGHEHTHEKKEQDD